MNGKMTVMRRRSCRKIACQAQKPQQRICNHAAFKQGELFTDSERDEIYAWLCIFSNSPCNGYSITWDNVQHLAVRRHQSSENKNTFHLWVLAFMTENRIGFSHLDDLQPTSTASELCLDTFLPKSADWNLLKRRMGILVQRILIKHFPEMHNRFSSIVNYNIPHEYSEPSALKSHVINLGVFQEDPSSTKGVVRIMKHLQSYIPIRGDGTTHKILVNGDQLSVERMVGARKSMAASGKLPCRFVGMEPRPQEFHKRCLLMQDTMNDLYSPRSVAEKGTLYQIRTKFGHRAVKTHVMDCVNHCTDFLNFTTEGMLCLLAMKVGNMSDMSDIPKDCPDADCPDADRKKFLDSFADKLVENCWPHIYSSTIDAVSKGGDLNAADESIEDVCFCDGKDISETFTTQCSALDKCTRKRYYHPSCVGLGDFLPEEDWWCCKDSEGFSEFCVCNRNTPDRWIGCDSEELCLQAKQGWFHVSCVGIKDIPSEEWFCCEECKRFFHQHMQGCGRRPETVDHLQEYSCAVLWEGLWHLAHRDAERENDGKAIISQWRLDMVNFWCNNHYKYLILGHRLLAGINGWLPPRLQEELTWNRVHNLRGGPGNNIPLDLINEFLNNDFKQNLRKARGQYTEKQVTRTSRMIGNVGKCLDEICEQEVMDKYVAKTQKKTVNYRLDVSKFVETYKDCKLFDHILGRCHPTFGNFKHTRLIKDPGKLRQKLVDYSLKLDIEKAVLDMP